VTTIARPRAWKCGDEGCRINRIRDRPLGVRVGGLYPSPRSRSTYPLSRGFRARRPSEIDRRDHQKSTAANEFFADLLRLQPRVLLSLDWAATQSSRAAILRTLRQMEHSTARLEEAVTYRESCRNTPVSAPQFEWAASKMTLVLPCGGLAKVRMGQRGQKKQYSLSRRLCKSAAATARRSSGR